MRPFWARDPTNVPHARDPGPCSSLGAAANGVDADPFVAVLVTAALMSGLVLGINRSYRTHD